jgi:molecular chaperone GrpE
MNKKQKAQNLQDLEQQVADLTLALQRERADSMNIRRRYEQQISDLKSLVKIQVIEELLPALDNFERALKHVPKDLANHEYIKGIQGVVKQFDKTLQDIGVERIKTVGEVFNPELHEAIGYEDGDGDQELITEELQAGYSLGGNIIRHAKVKVGNA